MDDRKSASYTPPETLQQLRTLVIEIGQGESLVKLGGKSYEVLGRLCAEPNEVAFKTISEIAERFSVNPSTMTRLSKSLGFKGFSEFQSLFRENYQQAHKRYYSEQIGELARNRTSDSESAVHTIIAESLDNLRVLHEQIDTREIESLAKKIAESRHVYLYAERQFYSLASYISYGLGLLRPHIHHLDAGLGLSNSLLAMNSSDLLIVVSSDPYTQKVIDVASIAKEQDVHVVAVTDFRSSPLVGVANDALFIPQQSSFIINSMAAHIVFSEGLINTVAMYLGQEAVTALKQTEGLFRKLNILV